MYTYYFFRFRPVESDLYDVPCRFKSICRRENPTGGVIIMVRTSKKWTVSIYIYIYCSSCIFYGVNITIDKPKVNNNDGIRDKIGYKQILRMYVKTVGFGLNPTFRSVADGKTADLRCPESILLYVFYFGPMYFACSKFIVN